MNSLTSKIPIRAAYHLKNKEVLTLLYKCDNRVRTHSAWVAKNMFNAS